MKYKLYIFANTQHFWQNYVSYPLSSFLLKLEPFNLNAQQNIRKPKLALQRHVLKNYKL